MRRILLSIYLSLSAFKQTAGLMPGPRAEHAHVTFIDGTSNKSTERSLACEANLSYFPNGNDFSPVQNKTTKILNMFKATAVFQITYLHL